MAFTAYPDSRRALEKLSRVLKPGGRLVILDISNPLDQNKLGVLLTKAWKASGDILRVLLSLLETSGFQFSDQEVGGFGSVHLYVATKPAQNDSWKKPWIQNLSRVDLPAAGGKPTGVPRGLRPAWWLYPGRRNSWQPLLQCMIQERCTHG